jgi:hypothetical protein
MLFGNSKTLRLFLHIYLEHGRTLGRWCKLYRWRERAAGASIVVDLTAYPL